MRKTALLCLTISLTACGSVPIGETETVVLNSSCGAGADAPPEHCKRTDGVQSPDELSAMADAWCVEAGFERSEGFIVVDSGNGSYLNGVTCARSSAE